MIHRSLAREHRTRMLAIAAASAPGMPAAGGNRRAGPVAPAIAPTGAAASEQALQLARLAVDMRRLKDIQSLEAKIALKRQLVPEYRAWIDGVLAAAEATGQGVDDPVLTQLMIWTIDIGDFEAALPMAEYVLRWRCPLPERFERTAGCLIAEEIAEVAIKIINGGADFDLPTLLAVDELVDGEDMPDEVRAKLKKAIGLQMARAAEATPADADGPAGGKRARTESSLIYLRRAQELDQTVGVKRRIEQLDRAVRKEAEQPAE